MILRLLVLVTGLLELLAPRKLVDFWLNVATTENSDVELRPWVYTLARLEGAVLVLWVVARQRRNRSGKSESATQVE